MQEKTHPQHETIFVGIPAETLESLDRCCRSLFRLMAVTISANVGIQALTPALTLANLAEYRGKVATDA